MKTVRTLLLSGMIGLLAVYSSFAATPLVVESARAHTTTGAFSVTITGATVTTGTTPSVITATSGLGGLVSGDQVQVTGVGGTTTVNTTAFLQKLSATTFSLFTDQQLTTGNGVIGTGTYTSGGSVSEATDISALSGDFTLRLKINALTASTSATTGHAVVCVQDSVDGFVSDARTLWCVNPTGGSSAGFYVPVNEYTVRQYQLPSLRNGTTAARLRVYVTQIDGSASVSTSLFFEQ